jgi:sugar/nucleoside kinase (ribokinase family)
MGLWPSPPPFEVPAFAIDVVDTTGCGDAFADFGTA